MGEAVHLGRHAAVLAHADEHAVHFRRQVRPLGQVVGDGKTRLVPRLQTEGVWIPARVAQLTAPGGGHLGGDPARGVLDPQSGTPRRGRGQVQHRDARARGHHDEQPRHQREPPVAAARPVRRDLPGQAAVGRVCRGLPGQPFQLLRERLRRRPAPLAVRLQRAQHRPLHLRGHIRPQPVRRYDLTGRARDRAGEQLVGDRAQAVHVGALVDARAGLGLLRRLVARGTGGQREARRVRQALGQTQVGEQDPAGAVRGGTQQHVRRLDVPVHDPRLVQRGGAPGGQRGQPQRLGHGQRTRGEQIGEGAGVGVLHHEVRPSVGQLSDVVDLYDPVRVGPAQQAGLGEEAFDDVEAVGPVVGEDLHGHRGLQDVVVREPDRAERAGAQAAFKAVAADLFDGVHRTIMPARRSRRRSGPSARNGADRRPGQACRGR